MTSPTIEAVASPDVVSEKAGAPQLQSEKTPDPVRESPASEPSDDDGVAEVTGKSTLPYSKAKCIALVATVTGASFLNTLSIQSVVIVLPTLGRELGIPDSRLQWVISAYSLSFGCFLLLWGRIADIYGKRLIFILGSALVTATMIANPFMPNEIAFDVFRGLQGLGAAANVPTAIGILGTIFPPGKAKNYAFSAYAAGAPLGGVFGNLLGGLIASFANWKWVFGATAALALLVTIAGIFFIPPPPENTKIPKEKVSLAKSVDWIGGVLITLGLLALMFAMTEGNVVGWGTVWIWLLVIISFLLIGIFIAWQWYQETHTTRPPLIKVSLFKNRRFCAALLIMGIFFAAFNDCLIYATYYFQDYQGLSPLQTTLRFIPTGVAGILTAFVVSRLISRMPTYLLLMFGNLTVAIACLLFAVPIPPTTSYFAYAFIALICAVVGADITWPCLTLFTSKSLPPEDQAVGGALINSGGQIGRSVGLAISTAIQTAVVARDRGVDVQNAGQILQFDASSFAGISATEYFNFVLSLCCMCIVGLAFHDMGVVGKIEKVQNPGRSGGEEGIMNEEDTRRS